MVKTVIKEIWLILHWICIGFQCETQSRDRIHERAHSIALSLLGLAMKTNSNPLQILTVFLFIAFFIFSYWPLIFDKIKLNTGLYWFLFKKILIFIVTTRYPSSLVHSSNYRRGTRRPLRRRRKGIRVGVQFLRARGAARERRRTGAVESPLEGTRTRTQSDAQLWRNSHSSLDRVPSARSRSHYQLRQSDGWILWTQRLPIPRRPKYRQSILVGQLYSHRCAIPKFIWIRKYNVHWFERTDYCTVNRVPIGRPGDWGGSVSRSSLRGRVLLAWGEACCCYLRRNARLRRVR